MADTNSLSNFLTDVADAIRTKKSTTEPIPAANFDQEILTIQGSDISDATATVDDVLSPKVFYNNSGKQTGTMSNNGELTYIPGDIEQSIPSGYTSGGSVKAVDITTLDEYKTCLLLSDIILGVNDTYTQLEYIETTGTQWINTEVILNKLTTIEVDFYRTATSSSGWGRIFGSATNNAYELAEEYSALKYRIGVNRSRSNRYSYYR